MHKFYYIAERETGRRETINFNKFLDVVKYMNKYNYNQKEFAIVGTNEDFNKERGVGNGR